AEYVNELQSVKSKFDDIVEGSVKLRDKRAQVRQLSEQFSENVMSLQRIASRLSAIIEVGMEMTAERNPARLVELFFAAACDIIDSKYAAVGMLDEQERELGFVFTKGVEARMYRDADAVLYDVIQRHAAQLQVEIGERRRAEQTVRESEAKFRELIEQASDGIFVTDSQGNFKLVNPRFCEMLGYREDALLRLNAADTYA